jgi:phage FluMu gp28-like protein
MKVKGIPLFKRQEEIVTDIINSKARYIALNASRQFSKSTILENVLMYRALNEKKCKCLYITPTYALSKIVINKLFNNLVDSQVVKNFNKSENIISFINGSEVYFRSGTNPDNIRGLSVNYVFIDESAFLTDDVWNVTRPTMAVIGKQCVMASTPRGKSGFFFQSCQLGMAGDPNYLYLFGHFKDNPFYNKEDVEQARLVLPDNIYKQEYLAEFLDDGGSVFQNVSSCQTMHSFKGNQNEGPYSIGIDLGRQSDFTVVTVLNRFNEVVDIMRINKKDWSVIIGDINSLLRKYKGASVLCETNGIGDVVFDLLKKSNNDIRPFLTTNETKNEIIEELIHAFQTQSIQIPSQDLFPLLHQELNTYSFIYSPRTRRIIYGALNGFHDDCVMSLAIALKGKNKRSGGFSVI